MNFLPSHDNRLTQASLLLPLRPMTSWRWPTGRLTLWLMRWGGNWASARLSWVESRLMCASYRERLLQSRHSPKLLSRNIWHAGCQSTCCTCSQMGCFWMVVSATCFCAAVYQTSCFRIQLKKKINILLRLPEEKNRHYSGIQSISDCASQFFVEFIPLFSIFWISCNNVRVQLAVPFTQHSIQSIVYIIRNKVLRLAILTPN